MPFTSSDPRKKFRHTGRKRDQREGLIDRRDAAIERLARRGKPHRLAVNLIVALRHGACNPAMI